MTTVPGTQTHTVNPSPLVVLFPTGYDLGPSGKKEMTAPSEPWDLVAHWPSEILGVSVYDSHTHADSRRTLFVNRCRCGSGDRAVADMGGLFPQGDPLISPL